VSALAVLTELSEFLAESPDLEVATVARARDAGSPQIRTLTLAGDAQEYFARIIAKRVGAQLDPLQWTIKKLDPLYKPDADEIEWQDLEALEPVLRVVNELENLSAYGPFNSSDEAYKRRLSYWAAVLSHADGRRAFFFRSFSAAAELKRKRGAALVSRHGTFSLVEDSIFVFDDLIDCFVFGDYVFVIRKRDFRRIFDQLTAVLGRAKRAAADLHSKVPIANFADFEHACSTDSRLADKILAVRQRDYFDDLSYSMLEPVIEQFALDISTAEVDGSTHLVFRTEPDQRFRILKLVDDDYLRSSMTEHLYEVNSKTDSSVP
jgi:hypothetical protein